MTEDRPTTNRGTTARSWRICRGWTWSGAHSRRPAAPRAVRARMSAAAGRHVTGRGPVRGKRRRWSGPGPDARDPRRWGRRPRTSPHPRVVDERSPRARSSGSGRRWSASRSPSTRTRPSLSDGVLTVEAESTAWATQLRMVQSQFLAKIAAAVETAWSPAEDRRSGCADVAQGQLQRAGPRSPGHLRMSALRCGSRAPTTAATGRLEPPGRDADSRNSAHGSFRYVETPPQSQS